MLWYKCDTLCSICLSHVYRFPISRSLKNKNKNTSRPWLILNWLNKSLNLELTNAFKHSQCLQKKTKYGYQLTVYLPVPHLFAAWKESEHSSVL